VFCREVLEADAILPLATALLASGTCRPRSQSKRTVQAHVSRQPETPSTELEVSG
jgi:hypothetical protein